MKILFTSDLHGSIEAFQRFSKMLSDFDCGVIAGDLLNHYCSLGEIQLAAEQMGIDIIVHKKVYARFEPFALSFKEKQVKNILVQSKKPVFIIKGNHDVTAWTSYKSVYNIHQKRIRFGGFTFIGYQYSEFEKRESELERDFQSLKQFIDAGTILVTHIPPKDMLDRTYYGKNLGCKALADLIREKQPFLHLFGHVHEDFGVEGRSINGSYSYDTGRAFVSIDTNENRVVFIEDGVS